MSSPEKLNSKSTENFERRMQNEYIGPMGVELEKIKSFFPNLDPKF
jgi:hypothetical protein